VTASGLVAIMVWYSIITPLVVTKYAAIQEVEREAAGVAHESLSSIRMVAACGADDQMADRYNRLVERASMLGKQMSPILAAQHSPGWSSHRPCFGSRVNLAQFSLPYSRMYSSVPNSSTELSPAARLRFASGTPSDYIWTSSSPMSRP